MNSMQRILSPLFFMAALTAVAVALPLAAAEPDTEGVFDRTYRLRDLDAHYAEVLLWEQCDKSSPKLCRVRNAVFADGAHHVAVIADDATHERIAKALAKEDGVPKTHSFQIVLLLADRAANGVPEALPANCRKAIDDVKGFLPFTRYRMVDAGLIRTADFGQLSLSGPLNTPVDVGVALGQGAGKQLAVRNFTISSPAPLLKTQFGIEVGETLVVGTSRLGDDGEALVALVSAIE